jgi:hypothetical protein
MIARHIREGLRLVGMRESDVDIVHGGKHLHVLIAGQIVTTLPRSPKHPDKSAKWLAHHLRRLRPT